MTRRERLEAKVEKREEWAAKAAARSESRFGAAHAIADRIPFGQPILVGHHSERKARRDQDKIHANMDKAVAEHKLAEHHASKGAGLASQLERTIFDDDVDAIERLEMRIKEREESAELANKINKAWRKGGAVAVVAAGLMTEKGATDAARILAMAPWLKTPMTTTGTRAAIRTDKERIETIKAKQARTEKAAQSPTGVLVEGETYVRVTFPEKPSRDVLSALRAAGFHWGGGSWHGKREALPKELA